MGVITDGNPYGFPEDLFFSFPVTIEDENKIDNYKIICQLNFNKLNNYKLFNLYISEAKVKRKNTKFSGFSSFKQINNM